MSTARVYWCALALALGACPGPGPGPQPIVTPLPVDAGPIEPTACELAAPALDEADTLAADGYLGRALQAVELAAETCQSERVRASRDALRAELWIDGPAEIHTPDAEVQTQARLFYRAGQILRERDNDIESAIARFERSYELWHHPLTIVQIGLCHRAAGRDVEFRKANARALAVAEHTRRAHASPELNLPHGEFVNTVAFHPTRPLLASGSDDNTIKLWDLNTGRVVHTLTGHTDYISSLAFDSSGEVLASGAFDHTLRVWDAVDGTPLATLGHHTGGAGLAFSPDGSVLASTDVYGAHLFEWRTGTEIAVLKTGNLSRDIAFTPDGAQLFIAGTGVDVFDVATLTHTKTLPGLTDSVEALAVSHDGTIIAAGGVDRVEMWDTATGAHVATLHQNDVSRITSLSFSSDDRYLASGGSGSVITIWDPGTRQVAHRVDFPDIILRDLAIDPARPRLAAVGLGGVGVVDFEDSDQLRPLGVVADNVHFAAFVAGEGSIVTAATNAPPRRWHGDGGPRAFTELGDTFKAAIAADGTTLAIARNSSLFAVDPTSGQTRARVELGASIMATAVDASGEQIAAGTRAGDVAVWTQDTGELRVLGTHADIVQSVSFDGPDRLASGASDGVFGLFDVPSGQSSSATTGATIYAVAISPDSATLASTGLSHDAMGAGVTLWDATSGAVIASVSGFGRWGTALAFHPGGAHLAVGDYDQHVRILGARDGALLYDLTGHAGGIESVTFDRDGRWLLSTSGDGTTRLWDARRYTHAATLMSTVSGHWVVVAADGRIDGAPGDDGGASFVSWRVGDLQLPGFVGWQREHTSGLLAAVLAAD